MFQYSFFEHKIVGLLVPTEFEWMAMSDLIKQKFPDIPIRISGMGKVRAALAAADLSIKNLCETVLLTGFCGGVRGLRVGDTVTAGRVFEGDFSSSGLEKIGDDIERHFVDVKPLHGIEKIPFVCQDHILTRDEYANRITWGKLATDMESYGAACAVGSNLRVIKVVSDIINPDSASDFKKAADRLGRKMALATINAIATIMTESTKGGGHE